MNFCAECMDAKGAIIIAFNWIEDEDGESRWLCPICYESVTV